MKTTQLITGIQHLGIPTKDFEKTVAFYEGLGFKTEWRTPAGQKQIAFLRLGDLVIETFESPDVAGKPGAIHHVALNVTDVDAVFEDIKSAGYKLLHSQVQELPLYEKGVRFFTIEGPNSEYVEFNEKIQ